MAHAPIRDAPKSESRSNARIAGARALQVRLHATVKTCDREPAWLACASTSAARLLTGTARNASANERQPPLTPHLAPAPRARVARAARRRGGCPSARRPIAGLDRKRDQLDDGARGLAQR